MRHAGIVDDNVKGRPVERGVHRGGIAHVDAHAVGLCARCGDLGCHGLQPVGPARGQRDRDAVARQQQREMPAKAARRAGDERALTVQIIKDRHGWSPAGSEGDFVVQIIVEIGAARAAAIAAAL